MLKKLNITKVLLFLVILSLENFCCLIPANKYLIANVLKYSDIGLIVSIIFTLWVFIAVKPKKKIKMEYKYKNYIFIFWGLIIISSIMANHFFEQPILWGIRSQRNLIICFLLYFPISRALQCEIITKDTIIKYIIVIGFFELILFTLQYFSLDKFQFLHYIDSDLTEIRLNHQRARFPVELILLMSFICLNRVLNNKPRKIINILLIVWVIIILFWMVQKRAQIASLLISYFITYLLWKKNISKKIIIGMLIIPVAIVFAMNSSIVQSTINSFFNRYDSNSIDTISIREEGINYYIEKTKDSPIFGYGLPNENCERAILGSGQQYYFYLADDGIFGFLYIMGLSGIIWLIFFWHNILKNSIKLNKKHIYIFCLYFIYETAELYIGMKWFYYWPLPFIIALSLLDYYIYDDNQKKERF